MSEVREWLEDVLDSAEVVASRVHLAWTHCWKDWLRDCSNEQHGFLAVFFLTGENLQCLALLVPHDGGKSARFVGYYYTRRRTETAYCGRRLTNLLNEYSTQDYFGRLFFVSVKLNIIDNNYYYDLFLDGYRVYLYNIKVTRKITFRPRHFFKIFLNYPPIKTSLCWNGELCVSNQYYWEMFGLNEGK